MAARAFDQCSDLGYYLDMIIDRASGIAALYRAAQMYTGPATLGAHPPVCTHALICLTLVLCRRLLRTRASLRLPVPGFRRSVLSAAACGGARTRRDCLPGGRQRSAPKVDGPGFLDRTRGARAPSSDEPERK